jgi:hypothetical protein
MYRSRVLLCLSLLVILPALVFAQGYEQQIGSGNVNWTNQVVRATGIGAPNVNLPLPQQRAGAIKAAKMDALRNLLETVKGVNLNSETLVENAIVTSDVIQTKVEGAIKGYRVMDTRYMSSGDVEVDVEVPLTGILSDALLPQSFGGGMLMTGGQLFCPTCGQPWPAGKPVPAGMTLSGGETFAEASSGGVVSGLIVDARGLGLRPAMAPKVLDEKGDEVYGSKFVSREYAVDIGMVGYDKDVNRAAKNERVANTPMVVKGIQASGPNKTDVVISSADAQRVHGAAVNMSFLQHCKVMFVLD